MQWEGFLELTQHPSWASTPKSHSTCMRKGKEIACQLNVPVPHKHKFVIEVNGKQQVKAITYIHILQHLRFLYSQPNLAKCVDNYHRTRTKNPNRKVDFCDYQFYQNHPLIRSSEQDPPLLLLYSDGVSDNRTKNRPKGELVRFSIYFVSLGIQHLFDTDCWDEVLLVPKDVIKVVGVRPFLDLIFAEISWIQHKRPMLFDAYQLQRRPVTTGLYAMLGDLVAQMEALGFLRGGWDSAYVWCCFCEQNRRLIWSDHDFSWKNNTRQFPDVKHRILPQLQHLLQCKAPRVYFTRFRQLHGFSSISPLLSILYSPLQLPPCHAHHSLLGYLAQHFKRVSSFLNKRQLQILEEYITSFPKVNNMETFSSLCFKGFTAHQSLSFGILLIMTLPVVLQHAGMIAICKCKGVVRPIAAQQQMYFRLSTAHRVYDHYVCLREEVLSVLMWMAHTIVCTHLPSHDNHEEQVIVIAFIQSSDCAIEMQFVWHRNLHQENTWSISLCQHC